MKYINPPQLVDGLIVVDGVYSTKQIAEVFDTRQNLVNGWITSGFIPYMRRGAHITMRQRFGRCGNGFLISCLQLYYFITKCGWNITDSMRANAANYLFVYGYEPDETKCPSYRTEFSSGMAVDTAESIAILNNLNMRYRGHLSYDEWYKANDLTIARNPPPIVFKNRNPSLYADGDDGDNLDQSLIEKALALDGDAGGEATDLLTVGSISHMQIGPLGCHDADGWLTVENICSALNCSKPYVSKLLTQGYLVAEKKPGHGKRLFFSSLQFLYFCKKRGKRISAELREAATTFARLHEQVGDLTRGEKLNLHDLIPPEPPPEAGSPATDFTGETPPDLNGPLSGRPAWQQ